MYRKETENNPDLPEIKGIEPRMVELILNEVINIL